MGYQLNSKNQTLKRATKSPPGSSDSRVNNKGIHMSSDNLITVVDAVMGTGKSTWLINEVNANPKKKYIILTPYLPEVK